MEDAAREGDLRPPENVWVLSHSRHYLVAQFEHGLVFSHRFDRRREAVAAAGQLSAGQPLRAAPEAQVRWHQIHDLTLDVERKRILLDVGGRTLVIEAQGMTLTPQRPVLRAIASVVAARCGFVRHRAEPEVLPRYCRPGTRPRRFSNEAAPQRSRSIRALGMVPMRFAALLMAVVQWAFLQRFGADIPDSWAVAVFGLLGLLLVSEAVPRLRIDTEGLEVRGRLTRRSVRWEDVDALVVDPEAYSYLCLRRHQLVYPAVVIVTADRSIKVRATACCRRKDADRIAAVLARLADAWDIPCAVYSHDLFGDVVGRAQYFGGYAFDWLSIGRDRTRSAAMKGSHPSSGTPTRSSS